MRRGTPRRQPSADGLPIAVLHLLATGEYLEQAAGVARYGPAFAWLDMWTEYHPRELRPIYARHAAAIEQHARALGRA